MRLGFEVARFGAHLWLEAVKLPFRLVGDLVGHDEHEEAVAAEARPEPSPQTAARRAAAAPNGRPADEAVRRAPAPEAFRRAPAPETAAPPEPEVAIRPEPEVATQPEPELAIRPEPEVAPRELQPEEEPRHIDTQPELVGEFAEPGAEEGAGAQIRVAEPWEGYAKAKVADVLTRIPTATAEEIAVVQLYESTHRKRKTILAAVERREKELANQPPES